MSSRPSKALQTVRQRHSYGTGRTPRLRVRLPGEAVLVVLNLLNVYLPTLYRVAAFAIGAKLATMNVGMAFSALSADLFENKIRVALAAAHLRVHSAQRVSSLIVIELRIRTYRFPAGVSVAVLAWDRNGSVRICNLRLGPAHLRLNAVGRNMQLHARQHWSQSNRDCK